MKKKIETEEKRTGSDEDKKKKVICFYLLELEKILEYVECKTIECQMECPTPNSSEENPYRKRLHEALCDIDKALSKERKRQDEADGIKAELDKARDTLNKIKNTRKELTERWIIESLDNLTDEEKMLIGEINERCPRSNIKEKCPTL